MVKLVPTKTVWAIIKPLCFNGSIEEEPLNRTINSGFVI